MFFRVVLFVWDFVLDLTVISRMTDDEKDLEILLLRQQLGTPRVKCGQFKVT
jgi:hypothetical protein